MARRPARSVIAIFGIAFPLAFALASHGAMADDRLTLSGAWTASGVSESWSIGDWGEACGPKPRSAGGGGGSVQIKEMGGELSVSGAGRAWSTGDCWEQMPGLSRTSHSASGGGRFWRTRCATPPNDPRRATIVTTTAATDSSIAMNETGQYQFVIHDQNCTASVSRSRSYSLVRRESDVAAAASASAAPVASASAPPPPSPPAPVVPPPSPAQSEAKPAAARTCANPGDPARLEVFPSRKLLKTGDVFAFRATVFDDAGCTVPAKPSWALGPGAAASHASVEPNGTLTIAADAPEGHFEIVATVAGKGVSVGIEVATSEHYDALLATSGLNDAGESEQAAIASIAMGTIGGRAAIAEDGAKERKQLFLLIVGFAAACLGVAGLALIRRARRPSSASALAETGAGAEGAIVAPPPAGPPREAPTPPRGKICPTCGERYDGGADFCGKDGTTLVMVN